MRQNMSHAHSHYGNWRSSLILFKSKRARFLLRTACFSLSKAVSQSGIRHLFHAGRDGCPFARGIEAIYSIGTCRRVADGQPVAPVKTEPKKKGDRCWGSVSNVLPMPRTLTDEDAELIAQKIIEAISRQLATPAPATRAEPPVPTPPIVMPAVAPGSRKLAYTGKEVEKMLGVSTTTLWRLRVQGRIHPIPGFRKVVFTHDEVERFLRSSSSRG